MRSSVYQNVINLNVVFSSG